MTTAIDSANIVRYVRNQSATLARLAAELETLANGGTLPDGPFATYLDGESAGVPPTVETKRAEIEATVRTMVDHLGIKL